MLATIGAVALTLSGCAGFPGAPRFIPLSDAQGASATHSRSTVFGGLLFTAGVSPATASTGERLPGNIAAQTHRAFDSIDAILKRSGCTLNDVVHVSVYLADIRDEARMFEVVASRFLDTRPALTTVLVRGLPPAVLLEVDFVARLP